MKHPTGSGMTSVLVVLAVLMVVHLPMAISGERAQRVPIPGFRPPAVPLVLMGPYMNVWLRATNLTDDWATYVS